MRKRKAIIVDDESLARFEIVRLLKDFDQIEIVGEADSMESSLELIQQEKPDLIFLDINLGKYSGFELLEHISSSIEIIFITAYDQYAIRAFEVNALDYLLKPVKPERLSATIERLSKNKIKPELTLKLNDNIIVSHLNNKKLVKVGDISFIEAKGDYTLVHTNKNGNGMIHHTIKNWIKRLPSEAFIQVHRSYITNLQQIRLIKKEGKQNYKIQLKSCDELIPIGRSYWCEFKKTFKL